MAGSWRGRGLSDGLGLGGWTEEPRTPAGVPRSAPGHAGGGAQLPPRAVEEVTGQPLTGQKPARLSGMGWLRAG